MNGEVCERVRKRKAKKVLTGSALLEMDGFALTAEVHQLQLPALHSRRQHLHPLQFLLAHPRSAQSDLLSEATLGAFLTRTNKDTIIEVQQKTQNEEQVADSTSCERSWTHFN